MHTTFRRTLAVAVSAALTIAASRVIAVPARAIAPEVDTWWSLEFAGDGGDYITQGQQWSYGSDATDSVRALAEGDGRVVKFDVDGANGDWWYLTFAAPTGQPLTPGTYTGATRYPFHGSGPGLSLSGEGRGCNTLTGAFTVLRAEFGPDGEVLEFDATFEQHCEGLAPAARGRIQVGPPEPPPAPMLVGLTVDARGTANTQTGRAVISGTVTCTKDTTVHLAGAVTQVLRRSVTTGDFATSVACSAGVIVPWAGAAEPDGSASFKRGDVAVVVTATAPDPDGGSVTTSANTAVNLRRG
jgi:hypothetical protein